MPSGRVTVPRFPGRSGGFRRPGRGASGRYAAAVARAARLAVSRYSVMPLLATSTRPNVLLVATSTVGGEVSAEVAALRDLVREALEAARGAARPGVTGRALYDIVADIFEAAGHSTQRKRQPGQALTQGFYFSLGHGVGLEVHEAPGLGLAGDEPLVPGDVIAIEPGVEGVPGVGGVRYEDLLLITADGCETLTRFPYDL